MSSKTTALLCLCALSLALWALCAWLAMAAQGHPGLSIWSWAAGWTAAIASLHTVLYALLAGRKEQQAQQLRAHGRRLQAEVTRIERRGTRQSWRVRARWRDPLSGREQQFKSALLRHNPTAHWQPGDPIVVYVHPQQSSLYWMDTGLPERTL